MQTIVVTTPPMQHISITEKEHIMPTTCSHSDLMIACRHIMNPEPHRRFVCRGNDCVCTECLNESMAESDILPNLTTVCRSCFDDIRDGLTFVA